MAKKILEEAIEQLRELPDEEQSAAADVVFAYIANDDRHLTLRPEQAADVRRIQSELRRGAARLANSAEVADVRKKTYL